MSLVSRVTDLAVAIRDKINAMMPRLLPSGGTAGQVLRKTSSTNYATGWATLPAATTTTDGVMSASDKIKLDAVGLMANRAATISASAPSGGVNGDVWFKT